MATSRQRVEDEDGEGLGGVIHLPLASYCSKVAPRSPHNRNLDSPTNMVRQRQHRSDVSAAEIFNGKLFSKFKHPFEY